jgi:hypothetical protein
MFVKMDLMNETTTIVMEEKERIKGWVNPLEGEAKQNGRST